jgi:hypothetical protein
LSPTVWLQKSKRIDENIVIFKQSVRQNGDPGETRTHNIQLRRLALYPIELRGLDPILTNFGEERLRAPLQVYLKDELENSEGL